ESRHRLREGSGQALDPPDRQPEPLAQLSARELLAAVEEEVARLPEAYRAPVLLCCLEGNSQEEAAAVLGWTAASVKGRLERGGKRLPARLVKRGRALPAALAAAEVARGSADVPDNLVLGTIKAALPCAAGKALAGASARAAALAEGVLRAMFYARLRVAAL